MSCLCGSLVRASEVPANAIATLCDPTRLATLKTSRAANPRVLKTVYWLEIAEREGEPAEKVVRLAMQKIGWAGTMKGDLTAAAILRNGTIAERLGCVDPGGLEKMRHGHCPIVNAGPYTGQILSVDHIIPRAIRPDLDNVIANLELLPLSVNIAKSDKMGQRQIDLEKKFAAAGLPSGT